MLTAPVARAVLPDEIQVYIDDLNDPGKFGLELHVNTTPSGRSTPDYPDEITPAHGLRVTPEFSYGLTPSLEAGAYIPSSRVADGGWYVAGGKLRLKWVPLRAPEGGGFFAGLNGELSDVAARFEADQRSLEIRPIFGWRDRTWLFATNPVLDVALSGPDRTKGPDFSPSLKVSRDVGGGVAAGIEYYADLGRIGSLDSPSSQQHTLYLAFDVDRKPWAFNFGVGRGLTNATDRWTVKAIFEIPIDE